MFRNESTDLLPIGKFLAVSVFMEFCFNLNSKGELFMWIRLFVHLAFAWMIYGLKRWWRICVKCIAYPIAKVEHPKHKNWIGRHLNRTLLNRFEVIFGKDKGWNFLLYLRARQCYFSKHCVDLEGIPSPVCSAGLFKFYQRHWGYLLEMQE